MFIHFRSFRNYHNSCQIHCRVRNHFTSLHSECHGLGSINRFILHCGYIHILKINPGIANHYTCVLLLKAKNLSKHSTYNSIAYHLYSSKLCTFLLSFLNVFGNIGFGIFIILGYSRRHAQYFEKLTKKITCVTYWRRFLI